MDKRTRGIQMKTEWKKELKNVFDWKKLFWVIFGNTAYCFGIVAFVLPMGLITGGTTGLGLIANHFAGIPVEVFAAVFNVVMFLLAIWLLGISFALTTLISTFYFPFILGVLQRVDALQGLTTDPLQYDICGAFDWSRNRSCHQSGSFHGWCRYSAIDLK